MKYKIILIWTICSPFKTILAWGFYGHQKINEIAVYSIPKPLFGFYKANVSYMVNHAADADKRRYVLEDEACKHFMDGDFYERSLPLDTIPKWYNEAIDKFGKDTVHEHGIVTWQILKVYQQLIAAFQAKDEMRILKLSADLGHYVGDCHVPLHATSNYNGQKTNQKGIHALWESRLTELNFSEYNLLVSVSTYFDSPIDSIWKAYTGSFALVDSVLKTERQVNAMFNPSLKYAWEQRGSSLVKVYSKSYCEFYHARLGNMIENRLKSSVYMLSGLIYTAWVEAGQPILSHLPFENQKDTDSDFPVQPNQKMIGREEE
jgi:hypothetical protein